MRRLRTRECVVEFLFGCDAARNETGLYYDKSAVKKPSRLALDSALALELRERSLSWVKPFLG